MCSKCGLTPCACDYIEALKPGRRLEHLCEAALQNWGKPLPHEAALPHPSGADPDSARTSNSCPCPGCWSARMGSWNTNT